MPPLNRRKFIKHSSLLLAASALQLGCNSNEGNDNPQAIVIGSGFAGSVAALRLGEAGINTVVLERGQQWTLNSPDTFPTFDSPDERTTWFGSEDALTALTPVTPYAGLIERVSGDQLDAVCGAGVGGGSLVYGGVLLQPRRELFAEVFPQLDYDQMDLQYFPRVLAKINAGKIPDDVLSSDNYAAHRSFIANASGAGFTVSRAYTGFDWDIIRREIAGDVAPAASRGDYVYGCNSGAKNSTDKNYLRDARATGFVEVRSLHEVQVIRELATGGYEVECKVIDALGAQRYSYALRAKYLFMAAGSLNSTKLLLKSQQAGELSAGNTEVGQGWGSNGDQLMLELSPDAVRGNQGGPACIAAYDDSDANYPVTFMHSPANVPIDIQIQLAMSVPDTLGTISYDASTDKAAIHWPDDADSAAALARVASFQRLLASSGGSSLGNGGFARPTIWHPLGGVVMGKACDQLGQLYGYQNLFVIDGSLLPGSAAAANPSLTIAANAERIMEQVIAGISS